MKITVVAGLLFLAVQNVSAQSADSLQKDLETHAAVVRAWAQDPTLVAAVRAQDAKKLTLADIQRDDAAWIAGKADALVKQMTTGPCADRLRELAQKAGYGESFVMDNQGALVCATDKTSDYWQGDEAKWTKSFDNGKGATFIDRPRLDESSKEYLAQISVPIMDEGKAIGAITAGSIWKPGSAPK
jgi:hypothetical protein